MTEEQQKRIEQSFRDRVRVQHGIDVTATKKRPVAVKKAEVEFFAGALAAIQALEAPADSDKQMGPPIWLINLMTGRGIV